MSRRSQTVATFAVKIKVPTGYGAEDTRKWVQLAIQQWPGWNDLKGFNPIPEISVTLTKKETTYGNENR